MPWIAKNISSGVFAGTGSGSGKPADTSTIKYITATDAILSAYKTLEHEMEADAQPGAILIADDGTPSKPAETRPLLSVTANKADVEAAVTLSAATAANLVTFTVSLLNEDETVNTGFDGEMLFRLPFAGKVLIVKGVFSAGVATRGLAFENTGDLEIASNETFRVLAPLSLTVWQ